MPDFKLILFSATADILNATAAIGVPALVGMGLGYLRKKFRLNIQEQTQQHLDCPGSRGCVYGGPEAEG